MANDSQEGVLNLTFLSNLQMKISLTIQVTKSKAKAKPAPALDSREILQRTLVKQIETNNFHALQNNPCVLLGRFDPFTGVPTFPPELVKASRGGELFFLNNAGDVVSTKTIYDASQRAYKEATPLVSNWSHDGETNDKAGRVPNEKIMLRRTDSGQVHQGLESSVAIGPEKVQSKITLYAEVTTPTVENFFTNASLEPVAKAINASLPAVVSFGFPSNEFHFSAHNLYRPFDLYNREKFMMHINRHGRARGHLSFHIDECLGEDRSVLYRMGDDGFGLHFASFNASGQATVFVSWVDAADENTHCIKFDVGPGSLWGLRGLFRLASLHGVQVHEGDFERIVLNLRDQRVPLLAAIAAAELSEFPRVLTAAGGLGLESGFLRALATRIRDYFNPKDEEERKNRLALPYPILSSELYERMGEEMTFFVTLSGDGTTETTESIRMEQSTFKALILLGAETAPSCFGDAIFTRLRESVSDIASWDAREEINLKNLTNLCDEHDDRNEVFVYYTGPSSWSPWSTKKLRGNERVLRSPQWTNNSCAIDSGAMIFAAFIDNLFERRRMREIDDALVCPIVRSFYEVLKALWTDALLFEDEKTFAKEPSSPFLKSCVATMDHFRNEMKKEMLDPQKPFSQAIQFKQGTFLASDDVWSYLFRNCTPENFFMIRIASHGCSKCKKLISASNETFYYTLRDKSLFYPSFCSLGNSNDFANAANEHYKTVFGFNPFEHFKLMIENIGKDTRKFDRATINDYNDVCACTGEVTKTPLFKVLAKDPLFLLLDVPLQFQNNVNSELKQEEVFCNPLCGEIDDVVKTFKLIAVLHGDQTHFVATRLVNGTWYFFDGMSGDGGVGVKKNGPIRGHLPTLKLLYSIESQVQNLR